MRFIPGLKFKANGGRHPEFSKGTIFDITNIVPLESGEIEYTIRNRKTAKGIKLKFESTENADRFIIQL